MPKGAITLTIVFEGMNLNRDQGVGGNILTLKKLQRGDGSTYTFVSRQALRYSLVRYLTEEQKRWKQASVIPRDKVNQFDILESDIVENEELDLFGFMYTIPEQRAFTRESVCKITPAISLESFRGDMSFSTDGGIGQRAYAKCHDNASISIRQAEDHCSFYKYSVVIDLDRIGRIDETEGKVILQKRDAMKFLINYFNKADKIRKTNHELKFTLESEKFKATIEVSFSGKNGKKAKQENQSKSDDLKSFDEFESTINEIYQGRNEIEKLDPEELKNKVSKLKNYLTAGLYKSIKNLALEQKRERLKTLLKMIEEIRESIIHKINNQSIDQDKRENLESIGGILGALQIIGIGAMGYIKEIKISNREIEIDKLMEKYLSGAHKIHIQVLKPSAGNQFEINVEHKGKKSKQDKLTVTVRTNFYSLNQLLDDILENTSKGQLNPSLLQQIPKLKELYLNPELYKEVRGSSEQEKELLLKTLKLRKNITEIVSDPNIDPKTKKDLEAFREILDFFWITEIGEIRDIDSFIQRLIKADEIQISKDQEYRFKIILEEKGQKSELSIKISQDIVSEFLSSILTLYKNLDSMIQGKLGQDIIGELKKFLKFEFYEEIQEQISEQKDYILKIILEETIGLIDYTISKSSGNTKEKLESIRGIVDILCFIVNEAFGDSDTKYRIKLQLDLSVEEKVRRIKDLLEAIKNASRSIQGSPNSLSPLLVIGGIVMDKNPFAHGYVEFKPGTKDLKEDLINRAEEIIKNRLLKLSPQQVQAVQMPPSQQVQPNQTPPNQQIQTSQTPPSQQVQTNEIMVIKGIEISKFANRDELKDKFKDWSKPEEAINQLIEQIESDVFKNWLSK